VDAHPSSTSSARSASSCASRGDASAEQRLVRIHAELAGVGCASLHLSGEEEAAARQEWGVTLDALDRVVSELRPEQQTLLRMRYGKDATLKECAPELGVSYWTIMPRHKETLALLRARLRALGVTQAPSWVDPATWGRVLGDHDDATEDGDARAASSEDEDDAIDDER
jgi:hypothetical protein